jgi:hypothetical protein
LLVQQIASLAAKASRPPVFGFANLEAALGLGAQLTRFPTGPRGIELYLKFHGPIRPEEVRRLKDLASGGISILWDPDINRDIAVIGGQQYALEENGLHDLGPAEVRFKKAGFFDTLRAKARSAQKLGETSGLSAMIILERGEGKRYPLFVGTGVLPEGLRTGDTVEAAYVSIVGERTLAGWHAPAEVFLEALSVELLHSSLNHPPLAWVNAREAIYRVLSRLEAPPAAGGKKSEAWQKAATAAVLSSLKKEIIYLDADDERYMYREIGRRAGGSTGGRTELRHGTQEGA